MSSTPSWVCLAAVLPTHPGLTLQWPAAYGQAASIVLEVALGLSENLCAVVAYYPDTFPILGNGRPPNVNILIHLAGDQHLLPIYRHYIYPDTQDGFAETHFDTYHKAAAGLAWTRSLAVLRKSFES